MTQTTESRRAARFLFRPLFIFISFMLVLFAILQASGRLTMLVLHHFEQQIALVTTPLGVRVDGLQGDWSGFNPVLQAERVVFAGGHAREVYLELDVAESILRSAWVLHRASVAEVYLDVVQTPAGWQLRGASSEPLEFDVEDLVMHSDELQGYIKVGLQNLAGEHSELAGNVRLANHSEQQYLAAQILSGTTSLPRELKIDAWRSQPNTSWRGAESEFRILVDGDFRVPTALLKGNIIVGFEQGNWSTVSGSGVGGLTLNALLELPELQDPITAEIDTRLVSDAGVLSGHVQTLALTAGDEELDLSGGRLQVVMADEDRTGAVRYWQQQLDLAQIRSFFAHSFGAEHVVGRWMNGTALAGEAHNLQAFFRLGTGLGYSATLTDLSMNGYRGAPGVSNAQARVWGHDRGAALQVNTDASALNFPDLFTDTWSLDFLQGNLKAWFRSGYLGLRGAHIKTRIGESSVAGSFSLTRPQERFEQRVALMLRVDQAGMDNVRSFIPYKIPDNLSEWLAYGPISGNVHDATFTYQGQVHKRTENGMHRRIDMTAGLTDTHVRYEKTWPIIDDLVSKLHVAGQTIIVDVESGVSEGVELGPSQMVLEDNAAFAQGSLNIRSEGQTLLDFVRGSPLHENLSFITELWEGGGQMTIQADLLVPIRQDDAPELSVELKYNLHDFGLRIPEYRTDLTNLNGQGSFSLPHYLTGTYAGELFAKPARIVATHDANWIRFDIQGVAVPKDIYEVAGIDDLSVMTGEFAFDSRFSVAMNDFGITNLELKSDMTGMQVHLPATLSKASDEPTALELGVQFLNEYQSIRWQYKETQGWVHFKDVIQRGAIGINANPPMTDHERQAILIAGSLDEVLLSDWVSGEGDAAISLPLDWSIQQLDIGQFRIDDLSFADVRMVGSQVGSDVEFSMQGEDIVGRLHIPSDDLVDINLKYLRLPQDEFAPSEDENLLASAGFQQAIAIPALDQENEDPLSVEAGYTLPAANVVVEQLDLGTTQFGNWSFVIEPQTHGVQFHNFSVDVNGIHIEDADVHWDLATNQSYFQGQIHLDDLKETLPKWDYAPALETDSAVLTADSRWAGSPANVSLLGLNGELRFRARDGRFLEVDSGGGLRVLSLLNFSNIAKRISFDFSDVTKEGMGFDSMNAYVSVNDGQLRFLDRMEVESKSSNFQIGGQVNLHTGILNNEMIVTLPVSDSLPWYGVYLAIANPLAGLGVLVGERVLRKPLRAFSTAKFEVKGTLDEPEVNFVGLWDQSMRETEKQVDAPPAAESEADEVPAKGNQLGGE